MLDPFSGTGTTTKVAKDLMRNSIAYDINEEYFETFKKKVDWNQKGPNGSHNYEVIDRREKMVLGR